MAYTSNYKLRNIPHLRSGLNDKYDSSEIADTDMADCLNVEVSTKSIRSAGGYVAYGKLSSTDNVTIDSHSESNYADDVVLYGSFGGWGQSFTATASTLKTCKFYLKKLGSPTGNAVAKVYAISGVSGSTATPTGSPLAVSDNFDVSTLTTSYGLKTFSFSGDNQISLSGDYCVTIEYSGGDVSNHVLVGVGTDQSDDGNGARLTTVWNVSTLDVCFYVLADVVSYTTPSGPFWGGFHAVFISGVNMLIRQRGPELEYDNGSGTWTTCTLPTTGSPAAPISLAEIPCTMEMLNDTVLWSNGTDSVMSSTDGITWTIPTTGSPAQELPKCKKLFNNGNNRILFMAQTAEPSRIDWSNINQPLTIDSTSYQYLNPNDGQEIVDAVLMPNGGMIVFKTYRYYAISDISFDSTAVDPIGEAPCVRHTAVATENSAIWAGPDGKIYEFDGGKANIISDNIASLNITRPVSMKGIYFNQKYRLAVPNGSDAFTSYEFVVDRRIQTGVAMNPYVITKNQRYIGCYIREDREVDGVRRTRLYIGDSRTDAEGSPAEVPGVFAYINDEHDGGITQGLDGVAQECSFTTKFYTEDVPFFIKRYTKYFTQIKSIAQQDVTLSYRFDQFSGWTDTSLTSSPSELHFIFGDGTEGGFSEGYAFSYQATENIFKDLESTGSDVRGIQFKMSWSSINDVEILSQAYKFLTKNIFH